MYDTLVLSGASAKGLLTLGALQYAMDNNLLSGITNYVGTSSGAMCSYLLAIGYTPIEIIVHICTHQLLEKMQHYNIVAMMHGSGAISFSTVQENLEKMSISKLGYLPTLEDVKNRLGKTLIISTFNLTKNNTEYLSPDTHPTLPCLSALRMSCNLPLIFDSYKYGTDYYVDGGISDNFALQKGEDVGNKILGIYISATENFNDYPDQNTLEFIYKLMFVPISQSVQSKIDKCSDKCTIVKLTYPQMNFFKFNVNSSEKLEMFSHGYKECSEQLKI